MKHFLLLFILISLADAVFAQYVYVIKADSVKLTSCDSSELIIENHTQAVPGFLFNTGNGRTVFKRALIPLNDSAFLVGGDTLHTGGFSYWKANYPHIYNTNPGNVGIKRQNPLVMLDLPGSVNIDDTAGYRIGYHTMVSIHNVTNPFTDIFVGDSAGIDASDGYRFTYIGSQAGQNSRGNGGTFVGNLAGMDNNGVNNTFVGIFSGQNNGEANQYASSNSYIGALAGAIASGSENSTLGASSGYAFNGSGNVDIGYYNGGFSNGDFNSFLGYQAGKYNSGNNVVLIGNSAGVTNAGNDNVLIGSYTGLSDTVGYRASVSQITLIGDSSDVITLSNLVNATAIGHKAIVRSSNTMVFGDSVVNKWLFNSGTAANSAAAFIVGSNSFNGNGAYLSTGGVWTNASDRFKKENFKSLDDGQILQKIAQLPITSWNYKGLSDQHIGPVAQDFYRIFQVGADDRTISTIDPSGIALAGIQGLYRRWQEAEKKSTLQQFRITEQQSRINALQAQLQQQSTDLNDLKREMAELKKMVTDRSLK